MRQTLAEYIRACGSMPLAARKIGVSNQTVFRWVHGQTRPRGLELVRLQNLGISIDAPPAP